jgi:hypothetical protein
MLARGFDETALPAIPAFGEDAAADGRRVFGDDGDRAALGPRTFRRGIDLAGDIDI